MSSSTSPKVKRRGSKGESSKGVDPDIANKATSSEPKSPKRSPKLKRHRVEQHASSSNTSPLGPSSTDVTYEWGSLPPEICLRIITVLSDDMASLQCLSQVNLFWHQIASSDDIWKTIFFQTFWRLEPSDQYYLDNGVPLYAGFNASTKNSSKKAVVAPVLGPVSWRQLFAYKYPLHIRWEKKMVTENYIKHAEEPDRLSMLVPWRGYVVTSKVDGSIGVWNPKVFTPGSSSKPKPWRVIPLHTYHIWWMDIKGDLCFTVSSDGTLKVTNLEPLLRESPVETIEVISQLPSIWCLDVNIEEQRIVIGCQEGTVIALSFKKKNWRSWKVLRTIKLRSGVWDVCTLPGDRFAACCNRDIGIFNYQPSQLEISLDEETPPVVHSLVGANTRNNVTSSDEILPRLDQVIAHRSPGGIVRNLNFIDGLLISAYSKYGLEAWDVDAGKIMWSIPIPVDVFDVGLFNNKLIVVGTDDEVTGLCSVYVFNRNNLEQVFEIGPETVIGRVFSCRVVEDGIYVCALNGLYHLSLAPTKTQKDSQCSVS